MGVGRRRDFGIGFLYGAYIRGNDFELIPKVKTETIHPVVGSLDSEFSLIYNQCGVMDD